MELLSASVDWHNLSSRIRQGDESAETRLYEIFRRGMCYLIARSVEREDVLDVFHSAFCSLIKGIRNGSVKTPAAIPGYARTIVVREIAAWINSRIADRMHSNIEDFQMRERRETMQPDHRVTIGEEAKRIRGLLTTLHQKHPLQVEILTRFYLEEQTPAQIIQELNLTADQFRNFKHRAIQFLSQNTEYCAA